MLHYGNKKYAESMVDFVLETLIFRDEALGTRRQRRSLKHRPENMGPLWVGWSNQEGSPTQILSPEDFDTGDALWPINYGYVTDDGDGWLRCFNIKSVKPSALRGKAKYPAKFNLRHSEWFYHPEKGPSAYETFSSYRNGEWADAGTLDRFGNTPVLNNEQKGRLSDAALFVSVALSSRYQWGAGFRMQGSAEVVLPVTPKGVLTLFNDRDKPETQDRRTPLKHWVQEFSRRTTGGDYTKVRQHLRANTKLEWRGYDVTIYPSTYDVDLNARLAL